MDHFHVRAPERDWHRTGNINWSASANVVPTLRSAKITVTGAGAAGNVLTLTISQAGAICAVTLPQPLPPVLV